jgi:hypothetical protein
MDNLLMPGQPQPADPPPAQLFSPDDIAGAHSSLGAIHDGLMSLATKPKGSLSKQDVFNSVAEMIAGGAFSTPQEKQAIVAQLAQMPDDEASIRQAVGQKLFRIGQMRALMQQHHPLGTPDA